MPRSACRRRCCPGSSRPGRRRTSFLWRARSGPVARLRRFRDEAQKVVDMWLVWQSASATTCYQPSLDCLTSRRFKTGLGAQYMAPRVSFIFFTPTRVKAPLRPITERWKSTCVSEPTPESAAKAGQKAALRNRKIPGGSLRVLLCTYRKRQRAALCGSSFRCAPSPAERP